MLEWRRDQILLTTDARKFQIDRIHRFLSEEAYWCLEIPYATVARAIQNSLCFGLLDLSASQPVQVGFARVVTDRSTFAWLCDVYVESSHRGRGLSKWMVETLLQHPDLQGLRRTCLATRDAHTLYQQYGFRATQNLGNWLEIVDNDIYKKAAAPVT